MGLLIYHTSMSLDGFIEDANGDFGFCAPSEEVHQWANDYMRGVGTFLFGRRMHETMSFWETFDANPEYPAVYADFAAVWRETDKIVYSTQLEDVTTARTQLRREFDPAEVRLLKADSDANLSVGGAELAAAAMQAGVVDVVSVLIVPVIVGADKLALPPELRLDMEMTNSRMFACGSVWLEYRIRQGDS